MPLRPICQIKAMCLKEALWCPKLPSLKTSRYPMISVTYTSESKSNYVWATLNIHIFEDTECKVVMLNLSNLKCLVTSVLKHINH